MKYNGGGGFTVRHCLCCLPVSLNVVIFQSTQILVKCHVEVHLYAFYINYLGVMNCIILFICMAPPLLPC